MGIVYFLSFVHIYIKAQQPLLVMDLKNTELDDLFQQVDTEFNIIWSTAWDKL